MILGEVDSVFAGGVKTKTYRFPYRERGKQVKQGRVEDYVACLEARYEGGGWICALPAQEVCRRVVTPGNTGTSIYHSFDHGCPPTLRSRLTTWAELTPGSPSLVPALPDGSPDWGRIETPGGTPGETAGGASSRGLLVGLGLAAAFLLLRR